MSKENTDVTPLINSTCLDLLLMELVPLSIRVSHQLEQESRGAINKSDPAIESGDGVNEEKKTTASLNDVPGSVAILESELLENEDVIIRIENYGFSIGLRICELVSMKQNQDTKENLKMLDVLDTMKFICRDVWKSLYGKQMDNLRTNHRGTFVLVDNNFRMINRFNSKSETDTIRKCIPYLWFPCGIIRGTLQSLGIEASVAAEITQFPSVIFNIQTTINN